MTCCRKKCKHAALYQSVNNPAVILCQGHYKQGFYLLGAKMGKYVRLPERRNP